MLNKEEIISIVGKVQEGEIIGYRYFKNDGYIFPIFKTPKNKYDTPTSGGSIYIKESNKTTGFMTLSDMLDLEEESETTYF